MSDFLRPHAMQHARPPCLPPTPGIYSNSCPLSQWASFLPKNTQDWSPLEWTGWISLQSKGLLFTFLLKLLTFWPLCVHLSGAGLPWHTHTPDHACSWAHGPLPGGDPRPALTLQQGGRQTFSPRGRCWNKLECSRTKEASMGKQSSLYTQGQG